MSERQVVKITSLRAEKEDKIYICFRPFFCLIVQKKELNIWTLVLDFFLDSSF